MRRVYWYIPIVLLAALAVWLWGTRFGGEGTQSPQEPGSPQLETAPTDPEVVDPVEEESGDAKLAASTDQPARSKSGDSKDDSNDADTDSEPQDDQQIEPTAAERVNALLDSKDLAQAHAMFRLIQTCLHAPVTEQEFTRHLEGVQRMRNDPENSQDLIRHLEGEEERTRAEWDECRDLHRVRGKTWAGDLFDRAARGDEFARFLYAMWAPRERASVAMPTRDLLAYESTALEFTLQNLDEGHPLGLLAFGLSYHYGRLFTPVRPTLGYAYIIAAELCSNGAFGLQAVLGEWLQNRERYQYKGYGVTTLELLETSTRLHDEHCATSITNTLQDR